MADYKLNLVESEHKVQFLKVESKKNSEFSIPTSDNRRKFETKA
jgi:hypothetical protein